MNCILKSKQFNTFENYVLNNGSKLFLSLQSQDGAIIVTGDLDTGERGLQILEKVDRTRSQDWIPAKQAPRLPAPLSDMKGNEIRSSAADFMRFWRGDKVNKHI